MRRVIRCTFPKQSVFSLALRVGAATDLVRMTNDEVLSLLADILPHGTRPKPFRLLQAAEQVHTGAEPKVVAKNARTTLKRLPASLGLYERQ